MRSEWGTWKGVYERSLAGYSFPEDEFASGIPQKVTEEEMEDALMEVIGTRSFGRVDSFKRQVLMEMFHFVLPIVTPAHGPDDYILNQIFFTDPRDMEDYQTRLGIYEDFRFDSAILKARMGGFMRNIVSHLAPKMEALGGTFSLDYEENKRAASPANERVFKEAWKRVVVMKQYLYAQFQAYVKQDRTTKKWDILIDIFTEKNWVYDPHGTTFSIPFEQGAEKIEEEEGKRLI